MRDYISRKFKAIILQENAAIPGSTEASYSNNIRNQGLISEMLISSWNGYLFLYVLKRMYVAASPCHSHLRHTGEKRPLRFDAFSFGRDSVQDFLSNWCTHCLGIVAVDIHWNGQEILSYVVIVIEKARPSKYPYPIQSGLKQLV